MDKLKIINLNIFQDKRGWFLQSYDRKIFLECGFEIKQENISLSHNNVFRGLHYQWEEPMSKVVQVLNGEIIDYVVDIRKGSPTYGILQKFHLKQPSELLLVPAGYAHGFLSKNDNTIVKYFCSCFYNSKAESSINFSSFLTFNKNSVILSERDEKAPTFSEYDKNPSFTYEEEIL